ncbi:hypothetical protein Ssi03_06140 [Sphaerisporangium siamense]|uniref:AMIN-like domain-containing protein n=1 Tax=Sphaerisporangium siamense TaxID=795645 RepID=A0A7W7DHR0_9ACTN|nr:hypothetical protein [Sphaerisporangium siamense]MBB4705981.1 hypothetical protein [Sphaerisporangium siamense]GII82624.1 hypothetical protein Ssi03_06140 [Sphaerisporangium siamense]
MRRTAAAIAIAPLALLAACGNDAGPPPGATVTATVSVTPSAPASGAPATPAVTPTEVPVTPSRSHTAATPDQPPPTRGEPVQVKRSPASPPLVTGVRYAGHEGYDRAVIDLRGAPTGYRVRWVAQLLQDGSGDPVPVKGGAYLQVSISPAGAHTEDGKPTWERVLRAGLPNLQSVVRTGDFEGAVTIGLVLRHRAAFRVDEQAAPYRLVIDIAH